MFHLVKAARLPAALRVVRGDVRKLPVRPVRAEEGAAPRRRLAAGELRRILACFFPAAVLSVRDVIMKHFVVRFRIYIKLRRLAES